MKIQSIILLSICTAKTAAFAAFGTQPRISGKTTATMTTTRMHATKSDLEGQQRRDFLNLIPAALITATATAASPFSASANDSYSMYTDETAGFEVKTPSGWQKSEQSLPDRRKIILFVNDNDASSTNKDLMFIAYTPVRDDFTTLSSFGSVDQVGQMTILPKGQIMGENSESKMLNSESKKNSYYFDYVTKTTDQPKRHFKTIFTLIQGGTGGAGSVLVTITVQTTDDRYEALKGTFDEVIESYGKIKK